MKKVEKARSEKIVGVRFIIENSSLPAIVGPISEFSQSDRQKIWRGDLSFPNGSNVGQFGAIRSPGSSITAMLGRRSVGVPRWMPTDAGLVEVGVHDSPTDALLSILGSDGQVVQIISATIVVLRGRHR